MTTLTMPEIPATPWARLRWGIADGWTVLRRDLWHLKAQPTLLISALIMPVAMVVLFGYVLGSSIQTPGGGNYREYLMPGLFTMISVFAVAANAMTMASDKSKGVMDRFRSMPAARSAVPFGQAGSDLIVGTVSVVIMAGCGLAVGWRAHHGVLKTVAAFALILLFRYAISWVGVYIGLAVRDERAVDTLGPLVFPITMISNTFVPTANMPAWLRTIADWNPISAITSASRALFGNPAAPAASASWPLHHPVLAALLWSAGLLAIFVPLAVYHYRTAE